MPLRCWVGPQEKERATGERINGDRMKSNIFMSSSLYIYTYIYTRHVHIDCMYIYMYIDKWIDT